MLNNILAGPILRRTTKNRICVWLALDSKQDLTLEILDLKETPIGRSDPDELEASRFKLGNGLYVYLLQAYPLDAGPINKQHHYSTGELYYYRLLDGQSTPLKLQDAGLTYGKHKHPIFHIPDKLTSVLHGSCRKPHGAKGEDCLAAGDSLLEATHNDVGKRPDLLLMTGDQIYADDVEASLLDELRRQAKTLMGGSETLPLTEYDDARQLVVTPDTIPLGGRTAELKKHHSGLSSTEADNHLMGFGEFAAMYIYVFGNARQWKKPTHWTDIETRHIPLPEMVKWQDYLGRWRIKSYADIIKEKKDELEDNAEIVNQFDASLAKVRRLLANIPTYMIFDDHDVTDDWNITGHWYDQVRSSPLGRRIVSNALAAYWAFQGWGNDPDNFDADMISSVTRHLNNTGYAPNDAERYDLMTWKHRGWGFSIAVDPPIIAMDSRTQRQPDNAFYPPRLMDRYALDWLRVEWSKLKTCKKSCHDSAALLSKDTCPILIATTPVFGFSPLEHVVRLLLWTISYVENMQGVKPLEKLLGIEGFLATGIVNLLDAESWTANLDGFTDLLNTVAHKMGIEKCVFLSGDVHYAFSVKSSYKSNDYTGTQQALECYQLTSSSLRNEPSDSQKTALDDLEHFEKNGTLWQHLKRQFRRFQLFRNWRLEHHLIPCIGAGKQVIEECNLGQVTFDNSGLPIQHTLLLAPDNPKKSVDYQLPPFKSAVTIPAVKT